ncbi:tetratricopeptide repeat protein [Priestia megaterium]|nr:tetratricopeptide repeat protein [Priestia megaterium]
MTNEKRKNIVAFPHLKERLIEKATVHMQQKQFQEALPLFQQAYEVDDAHHEILLGLVVCYVELGELIVAKEICEKMLREDIGDYYHNLQMFLMVLIQLGQYEEGYMTLQAVIQEHKLPSEHAEQIYQLVEFCKVRMSQDKIVEDETEQQQLIQVNEFLQKRNVQQQIEWIHSLKTNRMAQHRFFFENIFVHNDVHPIIKTIALKLLMEEKVDQDFQVSKFGRVKKVNPVHLGKTIPYPFTVQVEEALKDKLEHENPTMLQVGIELWQRHLFVLFPFLPMNEDIKVWTAAIHAVSCQLYGEEIQVEAIADEIERSAEDLQQAILQLKETEEISFI